MGVGGGGGLGGGLGGGSDRPPPYSVHPSKDCSCDSILSIGYGVIGY